MVSVVLMHYIFAYSFLNFKKSFQKLLEKFSPNQMNWPTLISLNYLNIHAIGFPTPEVVNLGTNLNLNLIYIFLPSRPPTVICNLVKTEGAAHLTILLMVLLAHAKLDISEFIAL